MYKSTLRLVCIVFVFGITGCSPQREVKNIDLTDLTIADIHKAYQDGRYNCEQLVSAYLIRVEQADNKLNAITTINKNAFRVAKGLDEEYKKTGMFRPLHGIPMIVKDNFNTKGLPTTAGALALQDFIPEEDAFEWRKEL